MSHIRKSTRSKSRTHRRVSKSGHVSLSPASFCRSFWRRWWLRPRATASSSYSAREPTTISGQPAAVHREAATREAMRSKGSVTMGHPAQSTSQPVVWALHSGVSRKTSARPDRGMWMCFGLTSVKMMRSSATPSRAASRRMRASPYGGKRSSHSTLLGTRSRMLHQVWNVAGSYLYSWLEQAYTTLSSGSPTSAREMLAISCMACR
mmetsp:Transcript_35177/g.99191  ORF Transcript_35177/g.99191 Transcript_35177/m.99191 type:complete len:207 (+) Transcript_35177:214-834(+)